MGTRCDVLGERAQGLELKPRPRAAQVNAVSRIWRVGSDSGISGASL